MYSLGRSPAGIAAAFALDSDCESVCDRGTVSDSMTARIMSVSVVTSGEVPRFPSSTHLAESTYSTRLPCDGTPSKAYLFEVAR